MGPRLPAEKAALVIFADQNLGFGIFLIQSRLTVYGETIIMPPAASTADTRDASSDQRTSSRQRALRRVWRAADALRRLEPVVITDGEAAWAVTPLERINSQSHSDFLSAAAAGAPARLLITDNRAEVMHIGSKGWPVVPLDWPPYAQFTELQALADPTLDLDTPLKGPFRRTDTGPGPADIAAVKLMKLARLLPGAAIAPAHGDAAKDWLCTDTASITAVEQVEAETMTEVARARVPLEHAEDTQFISFRAATGGTEHLAILIGDPDRSQPVLTRLHSECFTGDLVGSLKCDCGEQLKGAIAEIADAGGGVVLYLAQEGRGIGLISKLKAYNLQDRGYDTVDANTRLGFDVDERLFLPAATILRRLGIASVRLMTNNPEKVAALTRFGVDVTERVQHQFPTNDHNKNYLAVKASRTGHLLLDDD